MRGEEKECQQRRTAMAVLSPIKPDDSTIAASDDSLECVYTKQSNKQMDIHHKWHYNHLNIILLTLAHITAVYGIYLGVTRAKVSTLVWFFVLIQFGATGIIAGAHRLWTHRSYRAHWTLRVFLMCCNTLALQYTILEWSWTHRLHHKYSDTNGDPHNSRRGFFFSHIGWVCVHPHPEVEARKHRIDVSDLYNDPICRFQKRFYLPLLGFFYMFLPIFVPLYFWSEALDVAFAFNIFRHVLSIHQTSLVNSAAHIFGDRMYDQRIAPTRHMFTTYVTLGEAFHNFHHAFPFDYSASEYGFLKNWNPMTGFIDLCVWLGLAWDVKKTSEKLVEDRIRKYGDIGKIDNKSRQPPLGVLWDYVLGFVTLFWALWIILFFKAVYLLA